MQYLYLYNQGYKWIYMNIRHQILACIVVVDKKNVLNMN